MEVTQFTYFQQVVVWSVNRLPARSPTVWNVWHVHSGRRQRLRPGLERRPAGKTTYGDVFHQNEVEQSTYNLNTRMWTSCSPASSSTRKKRTAAGAGKSAAAASLRAYSESAHSFNLLDARKAISVTERQRTFCAFAP